MNQLTTSKKDGFDRYTADIVGDNIRKGKGPDFYRAGSPIDMGASYVALMPSMRMGGILWQDSKVADIDADYVSVTDVPLGVREGYAPYSSIMLVDQDGLICTFTSSSSGGKNALASLIPQYKLHGKKAFPIVQFSSKARNNQFGTIDPVFKIAGWAPASKFAAITGEGPEPIAIAAPDPEMARPLKIRKPGKVFFMALPFYLPFNLYADTADGKIDKDFYFVMPSMA